MALRFANRSQLHAAAIETAAFFGACSWLIFLLRGLLFEGTLTVAHDNIVWGFPLFAYFVDGIAHGHLPFWNPFSHGGEPFFPSVLQDRLYDPIIFPVVWIGERFTSDLLILFNWFWLTRCLVASLGIHLLLRRWAHHVATRAALAVVAVLSAVTLSAFHQEGIINQFYTAPLMLLFAFNLFEGRRYAVSNWMGLAFFAGQSLQSYSFVGSLTALLALLLAYALLDRDTLRAMLQRRANWIGFSLAVLLVLAMCAPNIAIYLEQGQFQIASRDVPLGWEKLVPLGMPLHQEMAPQKIAGTMLLMPYGVARLTGTFSQFADFIGLIVPPSILGNAISEGHIFVGSLVFAIALFGLGFGRSRAKKIWLFFFGIFVLVDLGPSTPVHWLIYKVYPPLWFMRHTDMMAGFSTLALMYFFVLGMDRLIFPRSAEPSAQRLPRWLTWLGLVVTTGLTVFLTDVPWLFKSVAVTEIRPDWLPVTTALLLLQALAWRLGGEVLPGILVGLAVSALIFAPVATAGSWMLCFLVAPLTALWIIRRNKIDAVRRLVGPLLLIVIAVELGGYAMLTVSSEAKLHGFAANNSRAQIGDPPFPETRVTAIPNPPAPDDPQRYPELVSREGTVFSTPLQYPFPERRFATDTKTLLSNGRYDSLTILKSYSALVHSDLAPEIIESAFGIGAPIIHFYDHAIAIDGFIETMRVTSTGEAIAKITDNIFIDASTLRDGRLPFTDTEGAAQGGMSDVAFDFDTISLKIVNDRPGYLYFADSYTRDWTATVNGKPVPVLLANGGFKAVAVEPVSAIMRPGFTPSTVALIYRPAVFIKALVLFYSALSAAMIMGLIALVPFARLWHSE